MIGKTSLQISRRNLCLLLPSLAAAPAGAAETRQLPSKIYLFEDLPVHKNGENSSRPVFQGTNHSGIPLELHETDLPPGGRPHPPHHHEHEEMFMIREGTLEVTIEGQTTRIGPGSVAYVASNQEHGVRNPGPDHAHYFVFALGAQ